MLVILIICLVALLVGSVFSIFFSDDPNTTNGQTLNSVIAEINLECSDKIDDIIVKKYLADFDRAKYAHEFERKFTEFETLNFISNKENIILIGTPGAGKTHYATALGIAACLKSHSVLFVSVPNLIIELKEAMSSHQITIYHRKFENFDLIVLDELGYISFDKSGSELLFNLLSSHNDKGSIIITTNLTFVYANLPAPLRLMADAFTLTLTKIFVSTPVFLAALPIGIIFTAIALLLNALLIFLSVISALLNTDLFLLSLPELIFFLLALLN